MGKKKNNNRWLLRWIFSLIGLILMILIAVFLITNRDKLNSESIIRIFKSSKADEAVQIQLETDSSAAFAMAGDSLAAAFKSGVRLYSKSGETILSESANLANPAVSASSKWAAAYDIGGTNLSVVSSDGKRADIDVDNPVISVSLSSGGMAVATEEQGYKGSVSVYDSSMSAVYKWYSGSGYITGAAVSPNGKSMAALTISTEGSRLSAFSLDSEEVQGTYVDENTLALDIAFLSDSRIAVLTNSSLRIFSASAELENEYVFGNMQLMDYSLSGDGFAVLALAQSRWSDTVSIVSLGSDGEVKKQIEKTGDFKALSAAGGYVSVLFSDRLELYRSGLEALSEFPAQGAQKVLQRKDGASVAIYDYMAEIYNP